MENSFVQDHTRYWCACLSSGLCLRRYSATQSMGFSGLFFSWASAESACSTSGTTVWSRQERMGIVSRLFLADQIKAGLPGSSQCNLQLQTQRFKLQSINHIYYIYLMEHQKVVVKRPHTFAMESIRRGSTYYDYENNINVIPKDGSNYVCQRKIGRGKYSEVFSSLNLKNSQKCVVKMLKPIKFKKINRQVKILMALAGKHNVIKLLDIVKESEVYCLVFEHIDQTDYRTILEIIQPRECKLYIYQILKGLHYAHSMGIMHRDIKPQNIIIDHQKKELKIIDWGLGEFYLPEKDYNVRVSSRYFKGPELLVSYQYYHYSLDIWSLGVMMAGMIFKKDPFFKGSDNYDQLQQITKTLGTEELYAYINKYNIQLEVAFQRLLGTHKSVKLTSFINQTNSHLATPDALDILGKMMQYDHDLRPTAMECMMHPYFDQVREENFQV